MMFPVENEILNMANERLSDKPSIPVDNHPMMVGQNSDANTPYTAYKTNTTHIAGTISIHKEHKLKPAVAIINTVAGFTCAKYGTTNRHPPPHVIDAIARSNPIVEGEALKTSFAKKTIPRFTCQSATVIIILAGEINHNLFTQGNPEAFS